ncbi:hypothetical protein GGI19_003380 [Coemansia pectinata]|uniref:Acyltransferase n=1 Tax=Coemansia pectinata TaxID=1052879 RepID=A0A9W8GZS7_9FUNG|nr:hypothetical protein GGI19_003380 [Coemansia pectinata]
MDRLLHGIQSQIIELCVLDTLLSFSNIPFLFYYGNDAKDPDFMSSEQLRDSFIMTLLDFPILVGHLEMDGSGHARVVVDKNNLNLPEYLESQSSVHFRDLQASKFSWDALPRGVATTGSVTTSNLDGTIKLANAHVVRLQDNSGLALFINTTHAVFDGIGYCTFVNRWAEISKWMRSGNTTNELPMFQGRFTRDTLAKHMPVERRALDGCTREMFTKSGLLSRWLAWISPRTRGALIGNAVSLPHNKGHLFHISPSMLALLHCSIEEYVDCTERVSDNDILTALVSMLVAQSEAEQTTWHSHLSSLASLASSLIPSIFAQDRMFATEIVIDMRPRLAGLSAAKYTGNAVFAGCLTNTFENVTGGISARSLALVARRVRQLVSHVDAPYIAQLLDMLNSDPSRFMCPLAQDITRMPAVVSNQSRFEFYNADFGSGIPAWVSPIEIQFPHYVSIIPVHPLAGGYGIHITMSERAMANILRNKYWMNTVDLIY